MNIHSSPKDCIRTNSGLFINVFEPTPDMITIEDIAHALSSQPRFGGHLNRHYSVAQHSIMCTNRAKSLKDKRAALMHDGSEAYLLDMPTPIKAKLSEYKMYEDALMRVIAEKFGFEYPLNPAIKEIDAFMLQHEWENLVLVDNEEFVCMTHEEAKQGFLELYYELFKEAIVV